MALNYKHLCSRLRLIGIRLISTLRLIGGIALYTTMGKWSIRTSDNWNIRIIGTKLCVFLCSN